MRERERLFVNGAESGDGRSVQYGTGTTCRRPSRRRKTRGRATERAVPHCASESHVSIPFVNGRGRVTKRTSLASIVGSESLVTKLELCFYS